MTCSAPPRGTLDVYDPWSDAIDNNPCGKPTLMSLPSGVDVSADSLCAFHYEMKYGQQVMAQRGIDQYTVLCLHADSLQDACGHPLTALGDAQVSTAQSKFGGASFAFDGVGDYLSSPDSPDWALGGGDFTIDLWIYYTNPTTNTQMLIGQFPGSPGQYSWCLRQDTGILKLYLSPDGTTLPGPPQWAWNPTAATWYHYAIVRSGNNVMHFINGTQNGSTASFTGPIYDTPLPLTIGANANGSWIFAGGFMDEIRVSRGIARWTQNFAVPTAPYS